MKENSKELREQAMREAEAKKADTLAEQIKQRLIVSWGKWQPDYEGWLAWSDDLYAEDAVIDAGNMTNGEQRFKDYQGGMKHQREACTMEMGPIMKILVEDNVASLIYHMYLTPKGMENASAVDMLVTEFNTLEEVNGRLMVTRLELFTDGGGMDNH